MQYNVLNVIDYFENKIDFLELSDIDLALIYLENNKNNGDSIADHLRMIIHNLLKTRADEVRNFLNILNNDSLTFYQQKLSAYYLLPFKNSKDIEIEKHFFSVLFNDKRIEEAYDYLLLDFTGLVNMDCNEVFNRIRAFLYYEGIVYSTVVSGSLAHPLNKYNDDNYIMSNYERDVGKFAELVVYNTERESLEKELADKVIWVPKYIGDGFGFDILSYYDEKTDKPIEVKGSLDEEKLFKPEVTDNEFRFFNNGNEGLIYQVYVKDMNTYYINKFRKEDKRILDSFNNEYDVIDSTRTNYKGKNNKILIKK